MSPRVRIVAVLEQEKNWQFLQANAGYTEDFGLSLLNDF
jgi:hypothetical protein